METKNDWELQEWQKHILKVHKFDIGNLFNDEDSILMNENEIPLVEAQREMLEKILYPSDSNPFYISDEKVRETLEAVLQLGFYYERDKKILNLVRESYLKGNNWFKRSYR